jgi:hypothetical protein
LHLTVEETGNGNLTPTELLGERLEAQPFLGFGFEEGLGVGWKSIYDRALTGG